MQDQTNLNKVMNEDQETNITTVLKVQKTIHEITKKSSTIRT